MVDLLDLVQVHSYILVLVVVQEKLDKMLLLNQEQVVLDCPHSPETQEFHHLMALLDQHQEDGLLAAVLQQVLFL
jgi:hypothetical protein